MKAKKCMPWGYYSKERLIEILNLYKDENNVIDMTAFRMEHPGFYSNIHRFFGGVGNALKAVGAVKKARSLSNRRRGKFHQRDGKPYHKTVRDLLARDMIKTFRNKGMSFEMIAKEYGVSREMISSLFGELNS